MRVKLSPDEKRIVQVLYVANRPLSTNQVSIRAKVAWLTAKKNLGSMFKRGLVAYKRKGKAIYWWLI